MQLPSTHVALNPQKARKKRKHVSFKDCNVRGKGESVNCRMSPLYSTSPNILRPSKNFCEIVGGSLSLYDQGRR